MKRRTLIAGVAAASAAVVAGVFRFSGLLAKHYPPTPYDDVLAALVDREHAAKLGALVSDAPAPQALAARLRPMLKTGTLANIAAGDITAGRLVEVSGWVVPESIALLSALAAKA
jgi:hypothetical protein